MNSPSVLPRVMKTNKQKPIVNPIDPMDTRVIIPTTTAKQKPIEKLKGFIKIPLSHIESVSIERPRGKNFYSVYHGSLEYRSTVMCMKINEIIDQLNNLQKKHG